MTFVYLLSYRHRSDSWVCGVFETVCIAAQSLTVDGEHLIDAARCLPVGREIIHAGRQR